MSEPTTSQKEQSSNQDEPAASQPVDPSEASLVAAIQRLADSDNDSRWDISTKRTVLVIMLVGIVFIGYVSRPIIPMVLVAFILAYLLNPIVNLAERVRIPRPISTIFIYLLVVVLLLLVPIIFIPTLINQLRTLATFDVSATALGVLDWANDSIQGLPPTLLLLGFEIPMTDLIGQVEQNMQEIQFVPSVNDILNYIQQFLSTTTNVVSSTATIGFSVVGGIFSVFLAILVTFFVSLYMTMDAPRIQAYFQGLFPTSYQSELAELLRRIGHTWQSFLRGQLILSITVGFTIGVSLSLVGMPGALIFGILAGLLEVVPNLGPIIAMIPAVITALIQGSDVLGPIRYRQRCLCPDHSWDLLRCAAVGEQYPGAAHHRRQHQSPPDRGNLRSGRGVERGRHTRCIASAAGGCHLPGDRRICPCQTARLSALPAETGTGGRPHLSAQNVAPGDHHLQLADCRAGRSDHRE